jgi:hypothetical protein
MLPICGEFEVESIFRRKTRERNRNYVLWVAMGYYLLSAHLRPKDARKL